MALYTRSGDQGLTGLLGGSRVPKQSARVEAYGTVDEAGAAIGAAKALCGEAVTRAALDAIQHRLSTLAAELASDGRLVLDNPIGEADAAGLERLIDETMAPLDAPKGFVIPGADPVSAALHQARTVVRRAERRMLTAAETSPVRPELITYVNRLSDALHALALAAAESAARAHIEALVRQALGAGTAAAFGLAEAKIMAEAAERAGAALGVPIVFAAVDPGGRLILAHRMGDSLLASIELAVDKAFTAAALRRPTAGLAAEAGPDGTLPGLASSHGGHIVVFGGGLPVFVDGVLAGGIGVSGGSVDQDVAIVGAALRAAQAGQEGTA
ncbi:MAG: cob(I)yrinic acid a,c-diamide adenosyltransferase [Actinomycetia bacterium]|nr:cob(I)yrinic acid a,c-diamide adenosyltransferase [Actinomycetes bacterium]